MFELRNREMPVTETATDGIVSLDERGRILFRLAERIRAAGGTVTEEPADQPWGERVARVLDPDSEVDHADGHAAVVGRAIGRNDMVAARRDAATAIICGVGFTFYMPDIGMEMPLVFESGLVLLEAKV